MDGDPVYPALYVKKRIVVSHGFGSVDGALNTIAAYNAMNIILKRQIRWLPKADVGGQMRFVQRIFSIAALPFTHSRPRSALRNGRLHPLATEPDAEPPIWLFVLQGRWR